MAEIKTPPIRCHNSSTNDEYVCFGKGHTLADIARWICENRFDAEEMLRLIEEILNE